MDLDVTAGTHGLREGVPRRDFAFMGEITGDRTGRPRATSQQRVESQSTGCLLPST